MESKAVFFRGSSDFNTFHHINKCPSNFCLAEDVCQTKFIEVSTAYEVRREGHVGVRLWVILPFQSYIG